jgi:hypothetical protein
MSDLATVLLAEARLLALPLTEITVSNASVRDIRALLRGAGWDVTIDPDPQDVIDVLSSVVVAIDLLSSDPIPDDLGELLDLVDRVGAVIADVRGIGESLAAAGGGAPPTAEAMAALGEDVGHYLVLRWLASKGGIRNLAEMIGLVEWVEVDQQNMAWLVRPAGLLRRLRPAALVELLGDPVGHLREYLVPEGWLTPTHAASTMVMLGRALAPLLGGRGIQFNPRGPEVGAAHADSPLVPTVQLALPTLPEGVRSEFGAQIVTVAEGGELPSGAPGPGVAIEPFGAAAIATTIGGFDVTLAASIHLDAALELGPGTSGPPPGSDLDLDLRIGRHLGVVLGLGRTGLTLGDLELSAAAALDSDEGLEVRFGIVSRNSTLGISTRDFGSAVANVLPLDLTVPFDLGLEWSSIGGLTLTGSASLSISLGNDIQIAGGVFSVRDLTLGLVLGDDIAIDVSGDVYFDLTVFQAVVGGVGLRTTIGFPDGGGNLGPIDLSFGIVPPSRVGLTVDLEAVRGGGFLDIDHEIGRYSGALAIEVLTVGITAITVIDTELPGEPDGFALFASLTISFPGIPLGFGFVLTGVGGLVAVNRTMDAEAIGAALRTGVIDSLLFPEDPIRDAATLIARIDEYFPLQSGSVVFGPVIEIGWGVPTPLITAQLGVMIAVPDGVIAILGSITAALPTPDAALITLHMDVLGVIDLPAGEISIVASLYDSRLLETIDLSGDMAMFVRATGQPYFLLSVGGYHPSFQPPSNTPSSMHDLRRMTASIAIASNVDVSIRAYFALTSNTVQFGASINVEASVEIWPTTYTARGFFEFNVLLQFSPFKLLADMSAGVGIYSGNKELMGVQLSLQLEGPQPWYVIGNATFKFFGVNVKFELEVGSQAAGEPKPTIELRDDVIAALEAGAAWSEAGPIDGVSSGLIFGVLDAPPDDTTVWIRPDHQLAVTQGVAPFDRDIEIVGQGVPAAGHERLEVTAARFGDTDVPFAMVDDWFAPAQYESLTQTERLTRASYEQMPAGVSFGTADVTVDVGLAATASTDYETEAWADDSDPLEAAIRTSGVGMAARFVTAPATPQFAVRSTTFTVVSAVDGTLAFPDGVPGVASGRVLGDGVSQSVANAALAAAVAKRPGTASSFTVVPTVGMLETEPVAP